MVPVHIERGQVSGLQELVNLTRALEETDQREWLPLPEVAAQPIPQIFQIALDASCESMWEYKICNGKIALTLAAKAGFVENVQMILEKGLYPSTTNYKGETPLHLGGDVKTLADDCASVLFKTAAGRSLGCIALLLEYGGSGNVPNEARLLPIHRVASEGHYLATNYLIAARTQTVIQESALSTVHSAVDCQNQFLELVIENGLDVNTLLSKHITSDTYDDRRKTALYCAVSNNEILCTKILLKTGENPNKDPSKCVYVAVRADSHGIVKLLLPYGADVNC